MLLTKDGVTFDVSHPTEIARLKHSGFVEGAGTVKKEKPAAAQKENQKQAVDTAPNEGDAMKGSKE